MSKINLWPTEMGGAIDLCKLGNLWGTWRAVWGESLTYGSVRAWRGGSFGRLDSSSASCLEMPLARQTTPDHLPTCITFLTGSRKAKSKAENKARAWVRMLFLVFWFILLTLDSESEDKYRRECWVDWFVWMGYRMTWMSFLSVPWMDLSVPSQMNQPTRQSFPRYKSKYLSERQHW